MTSNIVSLEAYKQQVDREFDEITALIHWITKHNIRPDGSTTLPLEITSKIQDEIHAAREAAPEAEFAALANPVLVKAGLPPMNYNIALREHHASTEAMRLGLMLVSPPGDWFALIDPLNRVNLGTGKKIEMSPDGKIFCGLTLEQVEACLAKLKTVQS
jgi:hypothetical protein